MITFVHVLRLFTLFPVPLLCKKMHCVLYPNIFLFSTFLFFNLFGGRPFSFFFSNNIRFNILLHSSLVARGKQKDTRRYKNNNKKIKF